GKDRIDLLKATFPGGSITGAPKVRAMEIIDELEPTRRSVYTGSMGYVSFNGDIDLNIIIRTFLVKGNRAYFQVGGAVVYDSDPESEYQETLDKARALMAALDLAEAKTT
ncbi:MAG: chorismate-binding protein, partial [Chloroflexi bacterium]|nr:chorismate-binding protein [Chloroflexota bacterium]